MEKNDLGNCKKYQKDCGKAIAANLAIIQELQLSGTDAQPFLDSNKGWLALQEFWRRHHKLIRKVCTT